MKKQLAVFLAVLLLLGVTACSQENNPGKPNNGGEDQLPEVIFGTWHPNPEISNIPIEIYSDGTCDLNGQNVAWSVESATEDEATLVAGEQFLIFSNLTSSLPTLSNEEFGYAVKEAELWNYMTDWHQPETGGMFTLSIEELAQSGCNVICSNGSMVVEVLENDTITYTVEFTVTQAVITTPDGNSIVYYSNNENHPGNHPGESEDDPEKKFQQAQKDFQNVLAGEYMTDYVDGDGVHHVISGAEAMKKLYSTFLSLQNTHDVSEYLSCIQKVENVLLKTYHTSPGLDRVPSKEKYNAYGQRLGISFEEAMNTGKYLYFGYNAAGKMVQVQLFGLVAGAPVYDAGGQITALKVTSPQSEREYTAPITYDAQGRVIRIDVPFVIMGLDEEESDYNVFYEFLYDDNNRLIQYSHTYESRDGVYENTFAYKEMGFFRKHVIECYYDAAGKLDQTRENNFDTNALGETAWHYHRTSYTYDASARLQKTYEDYAYIFYNLTGKFTPEEEYERMYALRSECFHGEGFVDSIGKDQLARIEGHYDDFMFMWEDEFEYGSIYIYQADE